MIDEAKIKEYIISNLQAFFKAKYHNLDDINLRILEGPSTNFREHDGIISAQCGSLVGYAFTILLKKM